MFALKAAIVVLVLFAAGVLRDRRSFGNAVLLGLALALLALGTAERLARAHDAVSRLVLLAVFALVALAPLLVAVYLVANGVTMLRRESVRPANLLSLLVGVGMWAERYVIVVISLHRDYLFSSWGMYYPTFWDWATYVGTIGLFLCLLFLFLRFLPMISIFEMRTLLPEAKVKEETP